MAIEPSIAHEGRGSAILADLSLVIDDFAAAWEQGLSPPAEEYLKRLDPGDSRAAVELIYREFCLAEANGCKPEASAYLARFPRYQSALERLMRLHGECPPSLLNRWMATVPAVDPPAVGDAIGPYVLRRELGRGGFANVFLAEQTNLENRLIVLKVSTRMTREPWLLARVRHAHIVEIVSHATVDDGAFHLICMPFWGGATLTDVLAQRRRARRSPRSGIDLLADLDAVAAPEFPTVHPARPAREILAGLSHGQAVAWIGARLAEALDHAFSREVAHGDVKPSNILLAADGNPMLLDFNLARDGSAAGMRRSVNEPGGTLAYMAPERLNRLAIDDLAADEIECRAQAGHATRDEFTIHSRPSQERSLDRAWNGPHQADIYSLGMVILEALTGRAPSPVALSLAAAARGDAAQLKRIAREYAVARATSALAMVRLSEMNGRRSIPPGLRAILVRCLDPDPERRYRRGCELAEDLDRWRSNRPLVYASEPFWGQTVPRWLRRQRLGLSAAALSLLIILATTTVALWKSHQTLQSLALYKIARLWDDPESRTYGFQRAGAPHLAEPDDPNVFETAKRALTDYDFFGAADWRLRDDVRFLPAADRDDLELWLLEQAYRNCRSDWRSALEHIEKITASRPLRAFAALHNRLSSTIGVERRAPLVATAGGSTRASGASLASSVSPSPVAWIDEYLLGIAAECELAASPIFDPDADAGPPEKGPMNDAVSPDAQARARHRAAQRALAHYRTMLAIRPDSYWGNYRAAAASFALNQFEQAAGYLERCRQRRPKNPLLAIFLAGCRAELRQYPEALEQCNAALATAPDLAEWYRSRAFIRAASGQTSGLADDIQDYEVLSRHLPRALWRHVAWDVHSTGSPRPAQRPAVDPSDPLGFIDRIGNPARRRDSEDEIADLDPDELAARAVLAGMIRLAGEPVLAKAELDKILMLEPGHIGVRMTRTVQALDAGRLDEALSDVTAVLNHPGLVEYLRKEPILLARFREPTHRSMIRRFIDVSRRFYGHGRVDEGRMIARRALDLAILLKEHRGESHYNLSRAYAVSAQTDRKFIARAADQLYHAFVAHPSYRQDYARDKVFDAARVAIDAALKRRANRDDENRPHGIKPSLAKLP